MNSKSCIIVLLITGMTLFISGCSESSENQSSKNQTSNKDHQHSDHDHSGHDHKDHSGHQHADSTKAATDDAYPLTTCVLSGEKLGSHGKPFDLVVKGRTVKLCCESCVEDVQADPEKFLAKIDAAAKSTKDNK